MKVAMKLGIITDEASQDFEEAAALAAKFGLEGLELRSVWEKGPHQLADGDTNRIIDIAKAYGMVICGISAPLFKCDIDNEAEVRQHRDILERCIVLAQKTGAPFIRCFSFWAEGSFEERFEEIATYLSNAANRLEGTGISLVLEFDPSVFACTGEMAARLVEAVGHPNLGLLWDPGNDIFVKTVREVPYPDGYERCKPHIRHIHIKDAVRNPDGSTTPVPVGDGDVDFKGQFTALVRDRYEGFAVLETHHRIRCELGRELLDLPGGSAFSAGGMEASEASLRSLTRIIKACEG